MSEAVHGNAAAVNRDNPWPGLASFTEEQRAYFFGREEETAELLRRVRGKVLTVLFGQSGLGKTSLVNAGLSPKLREEDMIPIVVRLNHDPAAPALADQVRAAIGQTISQRLLDAPLPAAGGGETLWEYFHRRGLELWTPRNRPATVVLVFDQFEEIYTLGRTSDQTRQRGRQFLGQLADLVENRPPAALRRADAGDESADGGEDEQLPFDFGAAACKVLLSLREDYLPDLEGFRRQAPSIAENRQRLQLMNGMQALHVLCGAGGRLIDRPTALKVVRFVGGATADAGTEVGAAGAGEDEAGLEGLRIEPALLSIFAHELNRKRQMLGLERITPDLLEGHRDRIIGDFYERSLADLPASVRPFIEDRLLTPSGFRDSLAMEIATGPGGLPPAVIDQLVARRLLHVDQRLGAQRLELTHDVLTGPVRSSRDARLQGQAIRQAREREQEVRAKLARARQRLMVTTVLAVLMMGLAFISYLFWRQAQASAQQARDAAQKAEKETQAAKESAGLATSSIEHTLMTLDWDEALAVVDSMSADANSKNTAGILRDLADKYAQAGMQTEETRARLWLAHVDAGSAGDWIQKNGDALATLLLHLMAERDEANWPKLEKFFAPAKAAICESIGARLPDLAGKSSAAERRAAVAFGEFAQEKIWFTGNPPQTWVVLYADPLEQILLDVMANQDPSRWKDLVDFFEPAHDAVLSRIVNGIGPLVDTEDINGKRLEAAVFFGARPKATADSGLQASMRPDVLAELSLSNPVQRAVDDYRQRKPGAAEPDPKALLVQGEGAYASKFAFCQSLPLNEALRLTAILRKNGYQLRSFRPYSTPGGVLLVAARWESGGPEGMLRMDLTLDEARDQEREMWLEGYAPDDLTCYDMLDEKQRPQDRVALVWRKVGPMGPRTHLFLNVSENDLKTNISKAIGTGFGIVTAQLVTGRDGARAFYGIASTDPKYYTTIARWEVDYAALVQQPAEGDRELPLDVRPQTQYRPDLALWWERVRAADVARLQADPKNVDAAVQEGEALLHLGQAKQAIGVLSSAPIDPRTPVSAALYWRVLAEARLGDVASARADFKAMAGSPDLSGSGAAYLNGIIAVCAGEPVPAEVDKLTADTATVDDVYNAACVYAWAAGMAQRPAEEREKLALRAIEILRQAVKKGYQDTAHCWVDSDLKALHARADFAQLLAGIPVHVPYIETFLPVPRGVAIDDLLTVQEGAPVDILQKAGARADAGDLLAGVATESEVSGARSVALWVPQAQADVAGAASSRIATYQQTLKQTLRERLQYGSLSAPARKWWDDFESANEGNAGFVLEIMQQLDNRKATIEEFYGAYLDSKAYNRDAVLHYLDFLRAQKAFVAGLKAPSPPGPYAAFGQWMENKPDVPVTDIHGWSTAQIQAQIQKTKDNVKFEQASADAHTWWARLEADNRTRPALVLRLLEELADRNSSGTCIDDLFEAAAYAHCDDLLAQLHYLDYLNGMRTWEARNLSPSEQTGHTALGDILTSYVRRRLLGLPPPALPAVAGQVRTAADLDAGVNAWCLALHVYRGDDSADLVFFVATACGDLVRDALAHNVVPDLPAFGARLAKAEYDSSQDQVITLFLAMALPAPEGLTAEQRQTLAQARDKVTQKYKDQVFTFIQDQNLGEHAGTAFYNQQLPNHLEQLFRELRSAYCVDDLGSASKLLALLTPDEKAIRAVLAEDVPADTLREILTQRMPTADEIGQAGLYGSLPDVQVRRITPEEIRNSPVTGPIARFLRPGAEFYEVDMGPDKAFRLVFWDGAGWKMLGPIWQIPELVPATAPAPAPAK